MREYLVDLTNHLIGRHGFDQYVVANMFDEAGIFRHIALVLETDDLSKMRPETLGKILGSLELGNVLLSKQEIVDRLYFAGDPVDLLRNIVACCLASVICTRLTGDKELLRDVKVPPYKRAAK